MYGKLDNSSFHNLRVHIVHLRRELAISTPCAPPVVDASMPGYAFRIVAVHVMAGAQPGDVTQRLDFPRAESRFVTVCTRAVPAGREVISVT